MRILLISCCLFFLTAGTLWADTLTTVNSISSSQLESRYLREARAFRSQGRYELARQSYALALSLCTKPKRMESIRQELERMEMILRTMR